MKSQFDSRQLFARGFDEASDSCYCQACDDFRQTLSNSYIRNLKAANLVDINGMEGMEEQFDADETENYGKTFSDVNESLHKATDQEVKLA